MAINPDKFQVILIDKNKFNITIIPLIIYNQAFKSVASLELLRIHLDVKLNFNRGIITFVGQLRSD